MREIASSGVSLPLKETEDFAGPAGSRGKGLLGLLYLTDTGRTWGAKHSVRDAMPGARAVPVETTDDLVAWIRSAGEEGPYLDRTSGTVGDEWEGVDCWIGEGRFSECRVDGDHWNERDFNMIQIFRKVILK